MVSLNICRRQNHIKATYNELLVTTYDHTGSRRITAVSGDGRNVVGWSAWR